jgi:hypothetical protein
MTNKTTTDQINEIHARCRRIETRLTKVLVAMDLFEGQPAEWVECADGSHYIRVAAPDVSLSSCLAVIPPNYEHEVEVLHHDQIIAVVNV